MGNYDLRDDIVLPFFGAMPTMHVRVFKAGIVVELRPVLVVLLRGWVERWRYGI